MKILRDLLEKQLQNLYNSELLILKALAEMQEYVTDYELQDILLMYTRETHDQKVRLEEIGELLKSKIAVKDGNIIRGLLEDVRELYREFPKGLLMDMGIITKLMHITHFQISGYESALLFSKNLDIGEMSEKLEKTLDEAYEADEYCATYAKNVMLKKK